MSSIAIITARGGSKRIPGKNKKDFLGKPILTYSIEAALKSGVFDEVMVSTDDEEIADIARKAGASVPFYRSAETANDFATTAQVLNEVLEEYAKQGREFEYLCCIYPTAPFITAEKLKEAMELLKEPGTDSVMPVVAFSFPPLRGMYIRDEKLEYCYPENALKRSQDLETMYHDCGQFYCINANRFMETGKLVMENTKAIIVPEREVQDIDTPEDWMIAEMKYRLMNENKLWGEQIED